MAFLVFFSVRFPGGKYSSCFFLIKFSLWVLYRWRQSAIICPFYKYFMSYWTLLTLLYKYLVLRTSRWICWFLDGMIIEWYCFVISRGGSNETKANHPSHPCSQGKLLGLDMAGAGVVRRWLFRHPLYALDLDQTATDYLYWVLFDLFNQDFLI